MRVPTKSTQGPSLSCIMCCTATEAPRSRYRPASNKRSDAVRAPKPQSWAFDGSLRGMLAASSENVPKDSDPNNVGIGMLAPRESSDDSELCNISGVRPST